jgi:hypothetical protein
MKSVRVALGFIVFTAIIVWATRPAAPPGSEERGSAPITASKDDAQKAAMRVATSAAAPIRVGAGREVLWEHFREKFGHELEPRFSPEGRLVSVHGRPGRSRKLEGFDPNDPRKALARAREIIESASSLLGVTPDWPLEQPIAKGSKVSAQVYFKEASSGVGVAPFGSVWVDLDSQGGLLGLDSSYIPNPTIVNSPSLEASDAKLRAVAAVNDGGATLKVEGGDAILWVDKDPSGAPRAYHAYEYYVQGRQVIVDAATGAILHKRDVRQY